MVTKVFEINFDSTATVEIEAKNSDEARKKAIALIPQITDDLIKNTDISVNLKEVK